MPPAAKAELRDRLQHQRCRQVTDRWPTPGALAAELDPTTRNPAHLQHLDAALVDVAEGRCRRLIVVMPPQEGKSERTSHYGALWMLARNPDLRIAIASYGESVARRWGQIIRNDVLAFPQLALSLQEDSKAAGNWNVARPHTGSVYCVGVGGSLTGRPVDCISGDTQIECEYGRLTAAEAFDRGVARILSYDHTTGRPVWRDVEAARRIPGRRVVEVITTAGRRLVCTPDHRVYTSRGYVPAGSLRPGDALVAVVAARRVPMRPSACGAEDGVAQGDPATTTPLLHPAMHGGSVLGGEPQPVLPMRPTGPAKPPVDLLRRVPAKSAGASAAQLPAVRLGVPAKIVADDVLHTRVREHRTLSADGRQGQLALQDRDVVCPLVPVDATAHSRTRQSSVRGLFGQPVDDVPAWRRDGYQVRVARAPHQRTGHGQPAGEPDHTLRGMPRGASQVETDTVAVVRSRGDATVDVYDFQVAGTRNFFGDGLLVHNCLFIDDPVKDRSEADSPTYRDNVWSWWTDVARTRLAPNAPVVLIMTRWHEDDLAGRLLTREGWRVLRIPAQAETDDPVGRPEGTYLDSARQWEPGRWDEVKTDVGSRTWNALYQGRPTPDSGNVWQRHWWRRYDTLLWTVDSTGAYMVDADEVVQSWDMAFKDTKGSDFVVGGVLARRGAQVFVLDVTRRRLSFTDTLTAFAALTAKWPQATLKLVEDKANGTAVIDTLRKGVPGIVPVNPTDSKYARATACSPFIEAGNVLLPDAGVALFDVDGLIEEAAAFPNGAHDDQVDMLSQGLSRILVAHPARHRRTGFRQFAA